MRGQDDQPAARMFGFFRQLLALAMALLLLLPAPEELFAQQAPYNGQYAPEQQQPGYAPQQGTEQQPGYEPQQPYPQSAYPPSYPQQPYAQQPSYGQYAPEPQAGYQQQQGYEQQSYPQTAYPPSGQAYPPAGYEQAPPMAQPLDAQQLEQLVAPIALYPDPLVAQVLAASTYPAQVADAGRWRPAQGYANPNQIAYGANAQPWDASVKALTAFPQVLAEMEENLQWTTALGNAYYNQPQDVLEAVQVLRQRAQAAGNLETTAQESVNYDQGNIVLEPANPQVIYVPSYNPWSVYGQQVWPYPGFSLVGALGTFFNSSPVSFGLGMVMTAFSQMSWGWLGWGLNWLTQSLLFHQSNYYSHSATVADWGFPHGGPRAFSRSNGYGRGFERTPRYAYAGNRPEERYNRSYQRPGAGYARQPYGRSSYGSSYGSGYSSRRGESYGSRPSANDGRSMQAYRAPAPNFGREGSNGYMGRSYAGSHNKQARSFGGGRAPKGFREKSFGGHSGGSGHQGHGGHGGGRHHFL